MQGAAVIAVPLTPTAHRRWRTVAKHLGATMAHTARDAVLEKLEFYEKKFKHEKADRVPRRLASLGESPLGPSQASAPDNGAEEHAPSDPGTVAYRSLPETDPLADLYAHHAQLIAKHIDDVTERRLLVEEAVSVIKSECIILEPPEEEIRKKLQDAVLRIRAQQRARGETPKPTTTRATLATLSSYMTRR